MNSAIAINVRISASKNGAPGMKKGAVSAVNAAKMLVINIGEMIMASADNDVNAPCS